MNPPLTCDQADLLLAAHALGDVGLEDHRRLREHLAGCAACQAAGARYQRVASLLPLAADPAEPPDRLRSRILAAVHAEAAAEPPERLRGRILSAVGAAAPRRRPGMLDRLRSAVTLPRGLAAGGALVTAAAVAIAVVALTRGGAASSPPPAAVVVRQACTPVSPATCATVRYDPAAHLAVLTVTGLQPPPSSDSAYEVWLVRADSTAVPAAFLSPSPDGSSWTAAVNGDMAPYVALAATLEPAGGSAAPTSAKVFTVDLIHG